MVGLEIGLDQGHGVRGKELGEALANFSPEVIRFRTEGEQRGDHQQRRKEAQDRRIGRRLGVGKGAVSKRTPGSSPQMLKQTYQHTIRRPPNQLTPSTL